MSERLQFNARRFLSLPVNSGVMFVDHSGCGCAKGNFHRSTNLCTQKTLMDQGKACGMLYGRMLPLNTDTLLRKVLDRAEDIHLMQGRPQYAKLFLIRALRMFNLVDFVDDVEAPAEQKEVNSLDGNKVLR